MWGVRFASNDSTVRSVKLSDGTGAGYDFPLHEENDHAYGVWSNGETFYVVDAVDAMIYTYGGVDGVVRPSVEDAETAAALVGNTTQSGDDAHDLGSTGVKRAQAFTTGPNNPGYALASVGIEFGEVSDASSAPSDLEATLNADGGGVPGDALCTLIAPANLSERSVNIFAAPASGTICPTLVKETTYFVVVERIGVTNSGTIAVGGTAKRCRRLGGRGGVVHRGRKHDIFFSGRRSGMVLRRVFIQDRGARLLHQQPGRRRGDGHGHGAGGADPRRGGLRRVGRRRAVRRDLLVPVVADRRRDRDEHRERLVLLHARRRGSGQAGQSAGGVRRRPRQL